MKQKLVIVACLLALRANAYWVCVSCEHSGQVAIIDGATQKIVTQLDVGKRPRGIHASPDGKTVYVALSGTPIQPPAKLDAYGNPLLQKNEDEESAAKSDKSADAIGVIDLAHKKIIRKIPTGSDPEQFAVSRDGKLLYVANEDRAELTVLNIEAERVQGVVPVSREPEGVEVSPDGKTCFVTCETVGDVFEIDTDTLKVKGLLNVPPRPRSVAFVEGGSRAFVPSESVGKVNVIDTKLNQVVQSITLPPRSRPMCVKASPDGKNVYVSTGRGGTVVMLDAKTGAVKKSVKVGARPWGIALSPDGKFIYCANGPSDDVSVVDVATEKEIGRIKTGGSPWGVVVVPDSP